MRSLPPVVLWLPFLLLLAIGAVVLLRACGLQLPAYGPWHMIGLDYCEIRKSYSQADDLRSQIQQLETQLARSKLQCAKQAAAATLPAERWDRKDLTLLEGCWTLGRDTESTYTSGLHSEKCVVPAGKICFGQDGTGKREQTNVCPSAGTLLCRANITARFQPDGSLKTEQPNTQCENSQTVWTSKSLTCRRQGDTLALCFDGQRDQEFRRAGP
jgi:hypothetical protein